MKNKPRAFSEKGEELFFDEEGNLINKKQTMKEEQETGWISALIKCDLCSHESLSVHHVSCNKLECGNCGHMSHYEVIEYFN